MEIYTLTGPSGTGKSYRAMDICKEFNIEGVIDDGLFIYKGMVVAGESAKRSGTKIGAIKAAIFNDEEKARKVAAAIKAKRPESILILGTSDAMTDLIIERLEINRFVKGRFKRSGSIGKRVFGKDSKDGNRLRSTKTKGVKGDIHRIYIEDITTEEERNEATKQRKNYGKHVIPAPAMELKRSFAGYFLDTLGLFKGRAHATNERTVVRPTYSYYGDYILSENVISDICTIVAEDDPVIKGVILVTQEPSPEDYIINIAVKIRRGCSLWDDVMKYQQKVNDAVEDMTAFNVSEVKVVSDQAKIGKWRNPLFSKSWRLRFKISATLFEGKTHSPPVFFQSFFVVVVCENWRNSFCVQNVITRK